MTSIATPQSATGAPLHPRFGGLVRGELLKVSRMRPAWIVGAIFVALTALPWLASFLLRNPKQSIETAPLYSLINNADANLALLRVWSGMALAVITALVIGLDYQQGTIRIVLARGTERLQFLAAKLVTLAMIAGALLVTGLVMDFVLGFIYFAAETGGTSVFQAITPTYWVDVRIAILVVVISMVATTLLTVAASVLGRSVAVGMTVGLSFFAADNIGSLIMVIVNRITGNDFWLNITGYFLGPTLNTLAQTWIAPIAIGGQGPRGVVNGMATFRSLGIGPSVSYDLTHMLVLIAFYLLVFAALAVGLTWRRDVLE